MSDSKLESLRAALRRDRADLEAWTALLAEARRAGRLEEVVCAELTALPVGRGRALVEEPLLRGLAREAGCLGNPLHPAEDYRGYPPTITPDRRFAVLGQLDGHTVLSGAGWMDRVDVPFPPRLAEHGDPGNSSLGTSWDRPWYWQCYDGVGEDGGDLLCVLDLERCQWIHVLPVPADMSLSDFSPDGGHALLIRSYPHYLQEPRALVVELSGRDRPRSVPLPPGRVFRAGLGPGGETVAAVMLEEGVGEFLVTSDVAAGEIAEVHPLDPDQAGTRDFPPTEHMRLSRDGNWIAWWEQDRMHLENTVVVAPIEGPAPETRRRLPGYRLQGWTRDGALRLTRGWEWWRVPVEPDGEPTPLPETGGIWRGCWHRKRSLDPLPPRYAIQGRPPRRLAFSPDGEELVTRDPDQHLVQVWSRVEGVPIADSGWSEKGLALEHAARLRVLFERLPEGGSRLLVLDHREARVKVDAHLPSAATYHMKISPAGCFALHDGHTALRVYDAREECDVESRVLWGADHDEADGRWLVCPEERRILRIATRRQRVPIHDLVSGETVAEIELPEELRPGRPGGIERSEVLAVRGEALLLRVRDGLVWLDAAAGEARPVPGFGAGSLSPPHQVSISADGSRLVRRVDEERIELVDLDRGEVLAEDLRLPPLLPAPWSGYHPLPVAISRDGRRVAYGEGRCLRLAELTVGGATS